MISFNNDTEVQEYSNWQFGCDKEPQSASFKWKVKTKYFERKREKGHPSHIICFKGYFCNCCLVGIGFLLSLSYKPDFVIDTYTWEKTYICLGISTICSFRNRLEVLKHSPVSKSRELCAITFLETRVFNLSIQTWERGTQFAHEATVSNYLLWRYGNNRMSVFYWLCDLATSLTLLTDGSFNCFVFSAYIYTYIHTYTHSDVSYEYDSFLSIIFNRKSL